MNNLSDLILVHTLEIQRKFHDAYRAFIEPQFFIREFSDKIADKRTSSLFGPVLRRRQKLTLESRLQRNSYRLC